MDETVYQCPECNFNADNLKELDIHILDNHSKMHSQNANNVFNAEENYNDFVRDENFDDGIDNHHMNRNHVMNDDMVDEEDDEEDFFNERANNHRNQVKITNGFANHHLSDDKDVISVADDEVIEDDDDDFFNETPTQNYNASTNGQPVRNSNHQYGQQAVNKTSHSQPTHLKQMNIPQDSRVLNSDNHYERQYACKRCDFFTNNPRAVLYHRKEFHMEKINVHECNYCQYASQYSGKVERHTSLRHKIHSNHSPNNKSLTKKQSDLNENDINSGIINKPNGGQMAPSSNPVVVNTATTPNTPGSRTRSQMQAINNHTNLSRQTSSTTLNDSSNTSKQLFNNSNDTTHNHNNNNSSSFVSSNKFQCDRCPCKYKRSSDLSKHLRQKHAIYPHNINEYLKKSMQNRLAASNNGNNNNTSQNESQLNDEYYNENEDYDQDGEKDEIGYNETSITSLAKSQQQQPSQNKTLMSIRNFNQIQRRSINEPTTVNVNGTNNKEPITKKHLSLECPYCTYYSNGNDSEYLLHVKEHLCGKSFRCVLCNSVYKYRGDCVVHLKRKHQKADMVAHSYVDRFNLDNIEITQICAFLKAKQHEDGGESEAKLFGCAYCDYKANYKGDVFKHQTRRHPGVDKSVLSLNHNVSSLSNSHNNHNNMNGSSGNNSYTDKLNDTDGGYANNVNDDEHYYDENDETDLMIQDDMEHGDGDGDDDDEDFFNERSTNNNNKQQQQQNGFNHNDEFDDDDEDLTQDEYNNTADQNGYGDDDNDEMSATATVLHNHNHQEQQQQQQHPRTQHRYQCKFCPFIGKNSAKLTLHLATHYNLKQYMCPVCKRRANFKWDIQKHLRKLHNNYELEVICLSEEEARKSIAGYIENNNCNTTQNSTIMRNVVEAAAATAAATASPGLNHSGSQPTFRFLNRRQNRHAIREKKFKCSLCTRTSKWQWDIKKHIRTVHKNKPGDVVVLNSREIINMNSSMDNYARYHHSSNLNNSLPASLNHSMHNNNQHHQHHQHNNSINTTASPARLAGISNSLFRNSIINARSVQTAAPLPPQLQPSLVKPACPSLSNIGNQSIGSDSTGNKKFKCTFCVYRSNWKADLFRHIRKRHHVTNPGIQHVIILAPHVAANTLEQYEQMHGINIRKRSRLECGGDDTPVQYGSIQSSPTKRIKTDLSSVASTTTTLSTMHSSKNDADFYNDDNDMYGQDNNDHNLQDDLEPFDSNNECDPMVDGDHNHQMMNGDYINHNNNNSYNHDDPRNNKEETVDRLPVSIAELNIKPYKCTKCGFRSDRKSDTLRHIRVKHDEKQAFAFLKILSIKVASETIAHYESSKASRRSMRNSRSFSSHVHASDTNNSASLNTSQTPAGATNTNSFNRQLNNNNNNNSIDSASTSMKLPIVSVVNSLNNGLAAFRRPQQQQQQNHHQQQNNNLGIIRPNMTKKVEKELQVAIDYYKCPFCSFKHANKMVMRRHLAIHFRGSESSKVIPHFRCSSCSFKSLWQYTVKNHIVKCHLGASNSVQCLKVLSKNNRKTDVGDEKVDHTNENSYFHNHHHNNNYQDDDDENENETNTNEYINNNNNNSNVHEDNFTSSNNNDTTANKNNSSSRGAVLEAEATPSIGDEEKQVESTVLTAYDGTKFTASYLVYNPHLPNGLNSSLNGSNQYNSNNSSFQNQNKKKMFFCQSCPYKTINYSNLKQHLLMHRYHDGFYKCRYCVYYVSMLRLLKQHEILHPEYEARETVKEARRKASFSNNSGFMAASNDLKYE